MPEKVTHFILELLRLTLFTQVAQQIELSQCQFISWLLGHLIEKELNLGLSQVETTLGNDLEDFWLVLWGVERPKKFE